MDTLFISDLHLEDGKPAITALFSAFLRGPARTADAVYILGDLFEFWIGDDELSATAQQVADQIARLRHLEIPCYFLHGNRDFLLGPDYAAKAGLQLLPETFVANLYGTPTLLLHGDTLCTDDVAYQEFRRHVRAPQFVDRFLKMPFEERLEMARNARDASKQHTASMSAANIMDVNETAVRNTFHQHGIKHMIHGHTHRPAFHQHDVSAGASGERIVLAAWDTSGSYLRVCPDGSEMVALAG